MDTALIFNPLVTPVATAIAFTVAVLAIAIWQRTTILVAICKARAKLFTRAGFFWSVISVFLAVSVWQGGAFFAVSGDIAGYAVALFLDLVTVVLMHAQLESRYRGEHLRANLFISFIVITCGMSTYANLAMSTNTFTAGTMLPNSPQWIQSAAPYALASSPLFVIMLSIASEMIVSVRPLDKLEESEYEADEQKRVRILEIRYQYALQLAQIEAAREEEKQRIQLQRATQQTVHKEQMKLIKAKTKIGQAQPTPTNLQSTTERNTDKLKAIKQPTEEENVSDQNETMEKPKRTCEWYRSQGQTNLTVQETAALCDTSEQVIRSLCTREKLKHPSPHSQLITLASVEAYLHGRKPSTRKLKQDQASPTEIEGSEEREAAENIDRLLASAGTSKLGSVHS